MGVKNHTNRRHDSPLPPLPHPPTPSFFQAGAFDGWTYAQIEAAHPEEFAARRRDKLRYRYPAGESYMDVVQR